MLYWTGEKRKYVSMKDMAVCVCHEVIAWLETDVNPPVWMCEIDDKPCEVKFLEDK